MTWLNLKRKADDTILNDLESILTICDESCRRPLFSASGQRRAVAGGACYQCGWEWPFGEEQHSADTRCCPPTNIIVSTIEVHPMARLGRARMSPPNSTASEADTNTAQEGANCESAECERLLYTV